MKQSTNVYSGYFLLTPEQRRFRKMLSPYSRLLSFWDFETGTCDVELLRLELENLPRDEQEMARFFVTMWQPGNALDFNVTKAIWMLNDTHWLVIQRWLATLEHPDVSMRMTLAV